MVIKWEQTEQLLHEYFFPSFFYLKIMTTKLFIWNTEKLLVLHDWQFYWLIEPRPVYPQRSAYQV